MMKRSLPRFSGSNSSYSKKAKNSSCLSEVRYTVAEASKIFNEKHISATPKLSNLERYGEYGAVKSSRFVSSKEGENLSEFLAPFLDQDRSDSLGKPKVVIITLSALRACDLYRYIGPLNRPAVKLFAKHMKLQEQIETLKQKKITIAVGTPNRILKLAESGVLSFDCVRVVLVDMKKDKKSYDVLSLKSVSKDFFELFRTQLQSSDAKISLW